MHDKAINRHFAPTLLAAALAAASGQAWALPGGQNVVNGSAIFAPGATSMTVTANAPRTVISWSGFDVAANETVSFNQNALGTGGTADILNIVQSGSATNILGAVTAGTAGIRVYIVNPNGFVLNAPGAGTQVGNALATGVASSINFSNVSVNPNAFNLQGGDMMLSLQHTVPQISNVSSMSGVNIPAAAAILVPTGANVVNGAASISNIAADFLSVHVTAPNTIIDWATFDLAGGSTVRFTSNDPGVAPGSPTTAVYNVLNRVNSGSASMISGTVDAYANPAIGSPAMNVFIMNWNGLVLGAGGNVQTNNATVTMSVDYLTNGQFLAGTMPTGTVYPFMAPLYQSGGGAGGNTGGNTGGGNSQGQGNQATPASLQTLHAALPQFSTYSSAFSAAQNAALTQLQNAFSQSPSASQQAANAMTQSVPQAMGQTQPQSPAQAGTSAVPASGGLSPRMVIFAHGTRGMQGFVWGNTLRANVRNGVVSLGL